MEVFNGQLTRAIKITLIWIIIFIIFTTTIISIGFLVIQLLIYYWNTEIAETIYFTWG